MVTVDWHEIAPEDRPKVVVGIILIFVFTLAAVGRWSVRHNAQRSMAIAQHDITFQHDAIDRGEVGILMQKYSDDGAALGDIRAAFVSRSEAGELLEQKARCVERGMSRSSECPHVATGFLGFHDDAGDHLNPTASLRTAERTLQEHTERRERTTFWLGVALALLAGASWWTLRVMGRGRSGQET